MSNLVLILCSPRTGSSIVSQIFWRHGCWVGEKTERHVNPFGYTSYENREIRTTVKMQWLHYNNQLKHAKKEKIHGEPIIPLARQKQNITDCVKDQLPSDVDHWMFKVAAESYPLFLQFEPKFIFVKRDEGNSLKSVFEKRETKHAHAVGNERRAETIENSRKIYRHRMEVMEFIEQEHGGQWVDVDELINGEYNTIQQAIEYCGLEYDPTLVDQSIDHSKWHYNKEE